MQSLITETRAKQQQGPSPTPALGEVERAMERAARLWRIALISFPLDLLVIRQRLPLRIDPALVEFIAVALMFAGVLSSARTFTPQLILWFKRQQRDGTADWQKLAAWLGVLLIAGAGVVQVVRGLANKQPPAQMLATLAVYGVAAWSMRHKLFGSGDNGSLSGPPQEGISLEQLYYLSVGRILTARALGLWAAVAVVAGHVSLTTYALYAGAALLLLLKAMPSQSDYLHACRRCAERRLTGSLSHGYCADCLPALWSGRAKFAAPSRLARAGRRLQNAVERLDGWIERRRPATVGAHLTREFHKWRAARKGRYGSGRAGRDGFAVR